MEKQIDAGQVILDFGGTNALEALLAQHGYDITGEAIAKWRERRMIPMRHWLKLLELDPKLDLNQYLN